MQRLYKSLNEKDRRRYAAIDEVKLGWGEIAGRFKLEVMPRYV